MRNCASSVKGKVLRSDSCSARNSSAVIKKNAVFFLDGGAIAAPGLRMLFKRVCRPKIEIMEEPRYRATRYVGKVVGSVLAILLFGRILHSISSAILAFEVPYAAFVLLLAGAYMSSNYGFGGRNGGNDHDAGDVAF